MTTEVAVPRTAQKPLDTRFGQFHEITYWLLWAVVFTVPWQNLLRIDGIGTVTRVVGMGAAGVAILAVLAEGRRDRITDTHIVTMLFAAWVIASAIWSIRPDVTYATVFRVVQVLALAWMVGEFARGPRRLRGILWAYVLGGALTATITILQYQLNPTSAARFSASEDAHPNGIAFMMCLAVPMAWYLSLLVRRNWVRIGLWLTIPLTVLAILMTASRSALLLLGVAGLIIPLTWGRLSRSLRRLCVIGGVLLLPFVVNYVPERPLERLSAIADGFDSQVLDARKTLADASWDITGDNPILGIGAGASRFAIADRTGMEEGAHNTYLSLVTELGIVGIALFLLVLATIWLRLLSTRGLQRLLAMVLGATLVLGLVPRHWEYDKATWLMLAIVLAIARPGNQDTEDGEREPVPVWERKNPPAGSAVRPMRTPRPEPVYDRNPEWP